MGYLLRESLQDAPVVQMGDYAYFVHPLTDGVPAIDPALVREAAEEVRAVANLNVDRIVTVEAMGIPLAVALSLETGIPVTIVRKRPYGLEGEIKLDQSTGYSQGELYVNGLAPSDRILIVDDVLSTGGTLRALLAAFRERAFDVREVVVLFEKAGGVRADLEREFGLPVKSLVRLTVEEGRVKVLDDSAHSVGKT